MLPQSIPKALLITLSKQARFVPARLKLIWLASDWIVAGWLFGFITLTDMTGMFEKLDKFARQEESPIRQDDKPSLN